jgi:hypothetical protein
VQIRKATPRRPCVLPMEQATSSCIHACSPDEADDHGREISKPSKMDISDLKNEIAHGRTVAQTASFPCRDEDKVREKMKELGLVERF